MTMMTASAWLEPGSALAFAGRGSSRRPRLPALLLALWGHALLLFALTLSPLEPAPEAELPLMVVLLRQAPPARSNPTAAETLAQITQEGGDRGLAANPDAASPDSPTRAGAATAVLEAPPPPAPAAEKAATPPLPLSARRGASRSEAERTEPPSPSLPSATAPEPLPPRDEPLAPRSEPPPALSETPASAFQAPILTAGQILASRGQEIAELSARIEAETSAYSNRPRRKAISASTQDYRYASYMEAWRRKVEAIGNLNYPEEAKRQKLYGNLILRVAVRADGSLEEVRVLRSSGSKTLDDAAVRIVHLAAPFAPFPPDIRKDTDYLDITRTWQFLSNNRFGEKR